MPKQPAFPGLRDAMKKKQTRRELFLVEMDAVVPRGLLMALIAPHYPKLGPKVGRPPKIRKPILLTYFTSPLASKITKQGVYKSGGYSKLPSKNTSMAFTTRAANTQPWAGKVPWLLNGRPLNMRN